MFSPGAWSAGHGEGEPADFLPLPLSEAHPRPARKRGRSGDDGAAGAPSGAKAGRRSMHKSERWDHDMADWGGRGGGEAAQDSLRSVGAALREAGLDSDSSGEEGGAPSGRGQPAKQGASGSSVADTQQQGAGREAEREPQSASGGNSFQALRRPGKARRKAPADGSKLAGPVSPLMSLQPCWFMPPAACVSLYVQ